MWLLLAANNSGGFHFGSTISVIATVLVICAAVGMVLTYTRSSMAKSTIELQSDQINAQEKRIDTLEKELAESKTDRDFLKKQISDLQETIRQVEALKTGSDAINALAIVLSTRWELNQQEHKLILDQLTKLS